MTRRSAPSELGALPTIAVEVLQSLHQHRVLTARQVHALHTPAASLRWAQRILTQLHKRGLTEHATGPHGLALWFLTAHGADTIQAAGTLAEPRRRLTTPAQAAGPLRAHTLAVNDTGIAFVKAAREHDSDSCGPLSWRHEIAHPYITGRGRNGTHLLIADALLSYLQATQDESLILHQRFIELDRGTIPPEQLAAKLARYAQLNHHSATKDTPEGPLWRAYYRTFPPVLVVLADQTPTAARRRIQKTIALYRSDPSQARYGTVPTSFTTLTELTAHGPFAPIFIPAKQPDHFTDWLDNTPPKPQKGETTDAPTDPDDTPTPDPPRTRPRLSDETRTTIAGKAPCAVPLQRSTIGRLGVCTENESVATPPPLPPRVKPAPRQDAPPARPPSD